MERLHEGFRSGFGPGILLLTALFLGLPLAAAQEATSGVIQVSVSAAAGGDPLLGVALRLEGTDLGGFSDATGRASFPAVPVGTYTLRATRLGFREEQVQVQVRPGATVGVDLVLSVAPVALGGIQVSVLRPDLRPDLRVSEDRIQETNPHDIGEVFRALPGMDAVRRGGLGLEPVIRGLRDTQVGAYVDGMRTLPGGPAGMDTSLSHVDPLAIRGMEVVKGPYALSWGSGNMSAVRVETNPLPQRGSPAFGGRFALGHDSNLAATETGAEVMGALERVGYSISGAWRDSGDYQSGSGVEIPGDFDSREMRARIGWYASPATTLTGSGWFQAQRDIDYPGRPLDAQWFDTYNVSLQLQHEAQGRSLRQLGAQGYVYSVDHGMGNDHKPTALANPNRMPPFPMQIETLSGVEMQGGRAFAEFDFGEDSAWVLEIGADGYRAQHDASSTVWNRDTGALTQRRLIWGGAQLHQAGVFVRGGRGFGRVQTDGTLRLDRITANADSASAFFLQQASAGLDASDWMWAGALTLRVPMSDQWAVSAGVGSVPRTPDANERYSDRAPSKRSQISAEFIGDPALRPERSSQVDLWLEAEYPRWRGSLSVFAQRMTDHITLERTDLPRQSPMSAPTVFRYVNGDAQYRGAEAAGRIRLKRTLSASVAASYLWGQDLTLDEPILGASPARGDVGLRWEPRPDGRFVEWTARWIADQNRVSPTRGELETPGTTLVHLQGGVPILNGLFLRGGILNIFDQPYVHHLNARSPFSGEQIPEPGRVFFARMILRF